MGGHQFTEDGGNNVKNDPEYPFRGKFKLILTGDHRSPNTPYPAGGDGVPGRGPFLGAKGIGNCLF